MACAVAELIQNDYLTINCTQYKKPYDSTAANGNKSKACLHKPGKT